MRIKFSQLRNVIRSVIQESSSTGKKTLSEGFKKPTRKELEEWSKGNYEEVVENDGDQDPCDSCGEMTPSNALTKSKNESEGSDSYLCQMCISGHL